MASPKASNPVSMAVAESHEHTEISTMSGAPGNSFANFNPTAPERGSFPLDHDHECSSIMAEYLDCLKIVQGNNALNCRLLAKRYLGCRMDNQLMEKDEWKNLGLPDDQKEKALKHEGKVQPTTTTQQISDKSV